jgi:hypothetical protein
LNAWLSGIVELVRLRAGFGLRPRSRRCQLAGRARVGRDGEGKTFACGERLSCSPAPFMNYAISRRRFELKISI